MEGRAWGCGEEVGYFGVVMTSVECAVQVSLQAVHPGWGEKWGMEGPEGRDELLLLIRTHARVVRLQAQRECCS